MVTWKRFVALSVGAALGVAACSSSSGDEASLERNITIPPTTTPAQALAETTWRDISIASAALPDFDVVSLGNGTAQVSRAPLMAQDDLKNSPLQSGVDLPPSAKAIAEQYGDLSLSPQPDIPDVTLLATIDRITEIAGTAPVIVRLPVPFDPIATGQALREGTVKGDVSVWKRLPISRGTDDPVIASATIALFEVVSASRDFARGTFDRGLISSAAVNAVDPKAEIARDGVKVTAADTFAQLGVVPYVRLMATSKQLMELFERGLIAGVELDVVNPLNLDTSTDTIHSSEYNAPRHDLYWETGAPGRLDGDGVVIAVLDTGVETSHPAFEGRLVDEACFAGCGEDETDATSTAVGSGGPCDLSLDAGCDHGTHVAGIALGAATDLNAQGVAPAADLISYRVCRRGTSGVGCPTSSVVEAMGRVSGLTSTYDIAAVNVSLGLSLSSCPNGPWTQAIDTSVIVLLGADVLTVQAQGNGGRTEHTDCVHPVVMFVANSSTADSPNRGTDFHEVLTDLWAPGTSIDAASTESSGPNAETKSGTSMAAPHVSGALALIRQGIRQWNTQVGERNALPVFGAHVNWMLGIDPRDPLRVMIADDRRGASGASKPRLSLHRLVELAAGPTATELPRLRSAAEITAALSQAELDQERAEQAALFAPYRPTQWVVNAAIDARVTIPAPSFPVGRRTNHFAQREPTQYRATLNERAIGADTFPPASALVGRPRLLLVMSNSYSLSITDGSRRDLQPVNIARGPDPCEGEWGGWTDVWELELTEDILEDLPLAITAEGIEPDAQIFVQWIHGAPEFDLGDRFVGWPSLRNGTTIIDRTPIVLDERSAYSAPRIGDSTAAGSHFWMGAILADRPSANEQLAPNRMDYSRPHTPIPYELADGSWDGEGSSMVGPIDSRFGSVDWNRVEGVHHCRVLVETYWVATD